jgi:hypothetical protein
VYNVILDWIFWKIVGKFGKNRIKHKKEKKKKGNTTPTSPISTIYQTMKR